MEDLPALLETINDAGARLFIVNTDSSRVEARKVLSGAIPESQVVFARKVSEVLTNPAAYEGVEGPVLKAVVIPAVVLIDPQGIVRSSRLWNGIAEVSAELERIAQGIAIDTPAREWVSHSASHSR